MRVAFLLPAIGIQVLTEVAALIEKPDANQRDLAIACRFQMIAGEHPQAA